MTETTRARADQHGVRDCGDHQAHPPGITSAPNLLGPDIADARFVFRLGHSQGSVSELMLAPRSSGEPATPLLAAVCRLPSLSRTLLLTAMTLDAYFNQVFLVLERSRNETRPAGSGPFGLARSHGGPRLGGRLLAGLDVLDQGVRGHRGILHITRAVAIAPDGSAAINNTGQVVGYGFRSNMSGLRSFLLTPAS